MNPSDDKKITVLGLGGVGGYLGALLADTYPHVSFVARGARGASIREKGLTLHSDYRGGRTVRPERVVETAAELPPQDYIFICVKNYSLEEACRSLAGCVTDHTVIVPVMNGADPGDRARAYIEKGTVIDSLIYIVAFAGSDFSVTQQGNFANLFVGIQDADSRLWQTSCGIADLLNRAGIDCTATRNIQTEIWRKYIFNCAYNVETALYDNNIGQLRRDPEKVSDFEALVDEAYRVALAKGVPVTEAHRKAILHRFYCELQDNATSSLQRDVNAGTRTELETFSGYIVREAQRLHVSAPVSGRIYAQLKEKCRS